MGALPFIDRCNAWLAKCGVRSTKGDGPVAELTNHEREIARFVARGMTNKEIATELFVSSKTVEYHLSRVYRKLNIANRKLLRELMQPEAQH
jgi:DNA-binding NarL/FixJ family response regulator